MKKNMRKTAIVILALAMLISMTACGASSKYAKTEAAFDTVKSEESYNYSGWAAESPSAAPMEAPMAEPEMKSDEGASVSGQGALQNKPNVKLIYTANMSIQTTEFDASVKALKSMVEGYEGYFENVYTYNGNYNSKVVYRNASYTVRVPSQSYTAFVNAIGTGFHVVNQNESVQDVGLQYSETEGRINTLKIKQERLQKLLSEAVTMEDIIDLENALSDCEWELQNYSSALNRYDSLIGYSTVYIELNEVERVTDVVVEKPTFGAKIASTFKNACTDFVNGCENFTLWLIENMFTLIIIAVICVLIFKLRIFSRLKERSAAKSEERRAKRESRKLARAEQKALKNNAKGDDKTEE